MDILLNLAKKTQKRAIYCDFQFIKEEMKILKEKPMHLDDLNHSLL